MTSMERAPEPTMEEILASIRRIISEDQSESEQQPSQEYQASGVLQDDGELDDGAESTPDDRIISDIARVLSGASQPPAEDEEEILDLTAELGGLEIVEEELIFVETVEEVPAPVEALAEPEFIEPAPEPEEVPQAPPPPEPQPQVAVAPPPPPQAVAAPEPQPIPEPAPAAPPPPMSASEEAASALDRAIAALRAGQLPTSISEFAPQPTPDTPPPASFYPPAQPEFEPQPEAQAFAAPEPGAEPQPEAEPEPEAEAELVLTDFEAEAMIEEASPVEPALEAESPPAWDSETPSWQSETPSWAAVESPAEPEPLAPLRNGHGAETEADDGAQKSLEDSVKDMLRPMLQRWLDENMTRVLTSALRDELRDNPDRFQRD
ncbi:MAG: DUF2497 domain-containing protein [Methyloceanibacter sp.]